MTVTPLLETRGLAKRYPGVTALKGVDLTFNAGEVHAIVGANGAGKSTFMNIVSGVIQPSQGELRIYGQVLGIASPAQALALGIATVHQEFSLVPQLTVAKNIYLGREPTARFGRIDRQTLVAQTRALLSRFSLDLDPEAEVSSLSVAQQQLVEIARALSCDARILILDEPTAVLSLSEQQKLFGIIRGLRARGMLVLYVSHYLREVLAIADRVTVFRDGSSVDTRSAQDTTIDTLVSLMVGDGQAARPKPASETARGNGKGTKFEIAYRSNEAETGFSISSGEIVGIGGLVGAGRTIFARSLVGCGLATASTIISSDGRPVANGVPREAISNGIIYITEDRKHDGLFADLDLVDNASAAVLNRLALGPIRRRGRETDAAATILERLRLVASSLSMPVVKLSGGNQQKVLIGRALLTDPKIIVCDEPTRGVDVGAKGEIHAILRGLADKGSAVIVISSEIEELQMVAERIVVMRNRQFVAELSADEADEATLLAIGAGNRKQGEIA